MKKIIFSITFFSLVFFSCKENQITENYNLEASANQKEAVENLKKAYEDFCKVEKQVLQNYFRSEAYLNDILSSNEENNNEETNFQEFTQKWEEFILNRFISAFNFLLRNNIFTKIINNKVSRYNMDCTIKEVTVSNLKKIANYTPQDNNKETENFEIAKNLDSLTQCFSDEAKRLNTLLKAAKISVNNEIELINMLSASGLFKNSIFNIKAEYKLCSYGALRQIIKEINILKTLKGDRVLIEKEKEFEDNVFALKESIEARRKASLKKFVKKSPFVNSTGN